MKYSPKKSAQVLKALQAAGGHVGEACRMEGISRKTFYAWMKASADFAESVDEIRDHSVDTVESALYKNALEGNVAAQIFYLKNKGRTRGWADRFEQEHSGPEGESISVEVAWKEVPLQKRKEILSVIKGHAVTKNNPGT